MLSVNEVAYLIPRPNESDYQFHTFRIGQVEISPVSPFFADGGLQDMYFSLLSLLIQYQLDYFPGDG